MTETFTICSILAKRHPPTRAILIGIMVIRPRVTFVWSLKFDRLE